ncbi:MAG: hypothetical protein QG670_1920 [Thermoproteota archaeon]|nr:hypothetical protein [Thermoproteota archaeon]
MNENSVTKMQFRYNGPELKAAGPLDIKENILKLGLTLFFSIENKHPDDENEVKSGYDHTFTSVSLKNFKDALKLRIHWISWHSKVVLLTRRYDTDIGRLYKQLNGLCDRIELEKQLEPLKEFPDGWVPSTKSIQKHPIGFIEFVVDRLELVEKLVNDTTKFALLPQSSLALFILCTCIESLGRSRDFVKYENWIKQKQTKTMVKHAFDNFDKNKKDSRDFLIHVLTEYNKHYSTRIASRNFFTTYINDDLREKLVKSIVVIKNKPPNFDSVESSTLKSLLSFLEDFRNNFAHRLVLRYSSPTKALWKELWGEILDEETKFMGPQITYSSGAFEIIITRSNLLELLTYAVRVGLWHWICEQGKSEYAS